MKIVVAADPFAVGLKDAIVKHLKEKGHDVVDYGSTQSNAIPYFDCAVTAAKAMQAKEGERGIFLCGSGMGMSLIANRFDGVRASVVESIFAAKMSRAINDANVLCLGAMIWGEWMALEAVDVFLSTNVGDDLPDLADFLKDAVKRVELIRPPLR